MSTIAMYGSPPQPESPRVPDITTPHPFDPFIGGPYAPGIQGPGPFPLVPIAVNAVLDKDGIVSALIRRIDVLRASLAGMESARDELAVLERMLDATKLLPPGAK